VAAADVVSFAAVRACRRRDPADVLAQLDAEHFRGTRDYGSRRSVAEVRVAAEPSPVAAIRWWRNGDQVVCSDEPLACPDFPCWRQS
jgi:hypothetical protein